MILKFNQLGHNSLDGWCWHFNMIDVTLIKWFQYLSNFWPNLYKGISKGATIEFQTCVSIAPLKEYRQKTTSIKQQQKLKQNEDIIMARITTHSLGRLYKDDGSIFGYTVRVGIGFMETEVSNTLVFHMWMLEKDVSRKFDELWYFKVPNCCIWLRVKNCDDTLQPLVILRTPLPMRFETLGSSFSQLMSISVFLNEV